MSAVLKFEKKLDATRQDMVNKICDPETAECFIYARMNDGSFHVFGTRSANRVEFIGAMEFIKHDLIELD